MRCLIRWFSLSASRIVCLLVLPAAVGATSALAQYTQSTQGGASDTHPLTGTVVNSVTGEAVPFALVRAGEDACLADQNGQFRFDEPASSQFALEAHKPGFFNDQEMSEGSAPPTIVSMADKPVVANIRLTPEAVIAGHIHTPDGDGIEHLPVLVRVRRVVNGRSVWQDKGGQTTDEDGNFRIAGLTPGTYFLVAGPSFMGRPVVATTSNSKLEGFSKRYYPGVAEISAATPLRLSGGQHLSIDFGLKPSPTYRIAGIVTGGVPAGGGMMLTDNDGESLGVGVRFDSSTGRFEAFPVPAGSYRLQLAGQQRLGNDLFVDVPITLNSDLLNLQIAAQRSVNIPVVMQSEIAAEVPGSSKGAAISSMGAQGITPFVNLRLVSRASESEQYWPMKESSAPDGTMIIRGVKPGIYDVEVQPNGSTYVASLTSSGADLLRDPLVVAEGSDPQPIVAVLRNNGASLDGTIRLDAPRQPATVLVFSEKNLMSSLHVFAASPAGDFHIQGLAPGDYDVLAFDRVDGIEYQNREALSGYLSRAAHVTLAADQQSKVTVDLIRTRE